jgi:hypothetical protein
VDDAPIELLPDKTGFVDADTFVTHGEILHADGRRTSVPRLSDTAGESFVDTKGTVEGTTEHVLKLANESTYLAFGIGVSLAAPLPTYVSIRRSADDDLGPLVRETADFNFSGPSSSGKSSVLGRRERTRQHFEERGPCPAGRQIEKDLSRGRKISPASMEHVRAVQQPQVHSSVGSGQPLDDDRRRQGAALQYQRTRT